MEKRLDKRVFENAISTMQKYGVDSILSTKVFPKREIIKNSLLIYYESTEEFEKCQFIKKFFEDLELQYHNKTEKAKDEVLNK